MCIIDSVIPQALLFYPHPHPDQHGSEHHELPQPERDEDQAIAPAEDALHSQ